MRAPPTERVSRLHAASGITASDAEGGLQWHTSRQADQRFARRRQPRFSQHERLQRWQRGAISPRAARSCREAWTSLCGPGSDWSQRSDASDWPSSLPSQGALGHFSFPGREPSEVSIQELGAIDVIRAHLAPSAVTEGPPVASGVGPWPCSLRSPTGLGARTPARSPSYPLPRPSGRSHGRPGRMA